MRSDAGETSGKGLRARSERVVRRWVSVGTAARLLEVSKSFVAQMERELMFGPNNSAVIKLPGREVGELRIRAAAVNRVMEDFAARREADRLAMANRTLSARRNQEAAHG